MCARLCLIEWFDFPTPYIKCWVQRQQSQFDLKLLKNAFTNEANLNSLLYKAIVEKKRLTKLLFSQFCRLESRLVHFFILNLFLHLFVLRFGAWNPSTEDSSGSAVSLTSGALNRNGTITGYIIHWLVGRFNYNYSS